MAKQRLNHSRYLDTYGEQRRSALEGAQPVRDARYAEQRDGGQEDDE